MTSVQEKIAMYERIVKASEDYNKLLISQNDIILQQIDSNTTLINTKINSLKNNQNKKKVTINTSLNEKFIFL